MTLYALVPVRVKIDGECAMNINEAHEIVEFMVREYDHSFIFVRQPTDPIYTVFDDKE